MTHHVVVVVWRVPGNPHPLMHAGEADSARAAIADGHLFAMRAGLGDYNVIYAGWMMDDRLDLFVTQDVANEGGVPYQSGPTLADVLHERLIERGDDDGDDRGGCTHDGPECDRC